jgi:signal transduction histidine kinase
MSWHERHQARHERSPWMKEWRRRVGLNPLLFLRLHIHRRLFMGFGFMLVATAMLVAGTVHLMGSGATWRHEGARVQTFVGGEFARVWGNPAARDELAARMAETLGYGITLRDASGAALVQQGEPCSFVMFRAPVMQGALQVGEVTGCAERFRPQYWHIALPCLLVMAMLWFIAGRMARRVLRPLSLVVGVAEDLAAGRFSSRAKLTCYDHGEERILAESLNRMAERIEQQMADQRELLAAVSHELRTPLGHLRLLTEMGRDAGATARTWDELDREVTEIDQLVGDLLAHSRLNFTALTPKPLDGVELAARALDRAGLPAALLQSAGPAPLSGDATLLYRALANLIGNAKTHAGGVRTLSVLAKDGEVRFEVDDAGPGFVPGDESRAFDPFFHKPQNSTGEAVSLGLGLALVKRIAEAHGGRAEAMNLPGGGARVAIVVKAQPVTVGEKKAPAPEPAQAGLQLATT